MSVSLPQANPAEHFGNLVAPPPGRPVTVIDRDGSAAGEKRFAIWNPPELEPEKQKQWAASQMPGAAVRRASAIGEAARLLAELVQAGLRTIAFVKVRTVAEVVLKRCRQLLPPGLRPKVGSYRSGYLAARRREIEAEIADGRLTAVVATNALELGIDIGELDATLHVGFPGSASSLWQQAGRGGRGERDSLAVLICLDAPMDQAFAAVRAWGGPSPS